MVRGYSAAVTLWMGGLILLSSMNELSSGLFLVNVQQCQEGASSDDYQRGYLVVVHYIIDNCAATTTFQTHY